VWNDQADRAAVFGGKWQAIVVEREQNIGTLQVFERDVCGVAFFGENENVFHFGVWFDELQNFAEQDAVPSIVQAAPTGDAMEVGGDFGLRQRAEFFPG
jgi:hypothetical protein